MVAPFSEQRKFHRTAVGKLRINLRLERKSRKLPKVAAKLKEMQDFIKSSRSREYYFPDQGNILFQIKEIFLSRSRKYFFPDQGHIKIKLNEAWAASPPPLAAGDGSTSDEIWLNWISNCHPSLTSSVKAMEWLYFKIVIFVCCTMRFQTRNKLFMKTKVLFNIKTALRLLLKRFK